MKTFKGKPITGATRIEQSRKRPFVPDAKETSADEMAMIKEPPTPFKNRQTAAQMPAGSGRKALLGVGDGKSANALLRGSPQTNLAGTGNRVPGGYGKVVGGQKGTSHPSRKGEVTMGTTAKRNAVFFGGAR